MSAASKSAPRNPTASESERLERLALTLLDDNPFQPRAQMPEKELEELCQSLLAQGLIQPIAAQEMGNGRYTIVAGHRRVAAFRRLLERATPAAERTQWETIPATIKVGLVDAQLAAQAYAENVARSNLSPVEEAAALEKMMAAGLAGTTEELATLTNQPKRRIERLRRLGGAPRVVKDAIAAGVMVTVGEGAAGVARKELRRLEFIGALSFVRLWEYFANKNSKSADGRTEAVVHRALANEWSKRRIEEYVDAVVSGDDVTEQPEAIGSPEGRHATDCLASIYRVTTKRFSVDLAQARQATTEQVAEAEAALVAALFGARERASPEISATGGVGR